MRIFAALACLGGLALVAPAHGQHFNSYKGKTPPELTAQKGNWLNSKGSLSLESLRGRLVYVEFSFLR